MTYDLGTRVPLTIAITDANGAPADATAVTLVVTLPDGSTVSPTPVHSAVGVYYFDYVSTMAGRHTVTWTATGTNAGVFSDVFQVRDPADLPIVGLAQVRDYLNIPATDTSQDAALQFYADSATEICERHRPLRRRTFTETFSGNGTPLVLTKSPVVSVASVTENGSSVTFTVDKTTGLVYKGTSTASQGFSTGFQNVVVVYVAGYADIPAVAQHAVLEQVRHMWATKRGARPSPSGGSPDGFPGGAFMLTYRVQELLDSLGRVPGFA